jgi:Mn2+/Fe2+ NRAMP family transporter
MSDLSSVFFGVPQSRYAALAILLAIVVVALTIIFGDSPVPVSQKFGFVLMVFLISLPGLALSLFQLTCIVTGAGFNNKRWWCNVYAWVLSAIMIFYSVLLVIAAIMSVTNKSPESFKNKHHNQEH